MKMYLPMLCCSILFTCAQTDAQELINGGFEPAKGLSPCKDQNVKVYNPNMGDNWAIGSAQTMQIADNTCSLGSPTAGKYFGVLKYAPPFDGNIIVFKLDKPLTVNKSYSFTLSYKIPVGAAGPVGGLRFGYTSDNTKADSMSGSTDPITSQTWQKDTLTLTPKQPWQYIWIEVSALGGDPFTVHVDDVKALSTTTMSVSSLAAAEAMHLAPNPFTSQTVLTVDKTISLPYHVAIYDITGHIVMEQYEVNTTSLMINRALMESGLYLLRVTDNEQRIYTSKLNVQ